MIKSLRLICLTLTLLLAGSALGASVLSTARVSFSPMPSATITTSDSSAESPATNHAATPVALPNELSANFSQDLAILFAIRFREIPSVKKPFLFLFSGSSPPRRA